MADAVASALRLPLLLRVSLPSPPSIAVAVAFAVDDTSALDTPSTTAGTMAGRIVAETVDETDPVFVSVSLPAPPSIPLD